MTKRNLIHTNGAKMHAHPYEDTTEIESIKTDLSGKWKYSPLFKNPLAYADIRLTGSRRKDYKLAEATSGEVHLPGKTVWHHAWKKDASGKYRMQLVDFALHQKTCPHAGGCKLWERDHNKRYKARYKAYKSYGGIYMNENLFGKTVTGNSAYGVEELRAGTATEPYTDFVIDYIFDRSIPLPHLELYSMLRNKRIAKKSFKVWGLDPYGNLFLAGAKGKLYFLDIENSSLIPLGINQCSILRSLRRGTSIKES